MNLGYLSFEFFWEHLRAPHQFRNQAKAIHTSILNMYKSPSRYYHNTDHIQFCVKTVLEMPRSDFIQNNNGFGRSPYFLALFCHDCVNIPGNKDNERLSSHIAVSCLEQLESPKKMIVDVDRYILVTTHEHEPNKLDEWMINDIDLATLSDPWEKFSITTEKIIKEYSCLGSREDSIRVQKSYLERFLHRKIYGTPFYEAYEEIAKDNIKRFIAEYK